MNSSALPDIGDLSPKVARMVLRVSERAHEILEEHVPNPLEPQELSPLATIHIEALAHLAALIKLHEHGATYHTAQGNSAQARLWRRDSITLQNISHTLASLSIT